MRIQTVFLTIVTAALLCACGSSRHTQTTATPTDVVNQNQTSVPATVQTTPQVDPYPGVTQFVSDLDLDIDMNNDSYSLGGKLYVKRNAVVRMNLTFMGFIEVGTLEFAPEKILIVNRLNKEYTRMGYKDWDVLVKNNITYANIENMAMQKFYAADGKKITDAELDKAIEHMLSSNIKGGKKIGVHIVVGKPDTKKQFDTYTTVKSSYSEVPAQTLVTKLMGFAK